MSEPTSEKTGLRFDPTFNAGNLMTLISLIAAFFLGWSTLDKRVLVLEEQRKGQEIRDQAQDARANDKFGEIKETLGEIKRGVESLREKQEKRP